MNAQSDFMQLFSSAAEFNAYLQLHDQHFSSSVEPQCLPTKYHYWFISQVFFFFGGGGRESDTKTVPFHYIWQEKNTTPKHKKREKTTHRTPDLYIMQCWAKGHISALLLPIPMSMYLPWFWQKAMTTWPCYARRFVGFSSSRSPKQ